MYATNRRRGLLQSRWSRTSHVPRSFQEDAGHEDDADVGLGRSMNRAIGADIAEFLA